MKTYEELEREAYINGYMNLAKSYAEICSLEDNYFEIDDLQDRIRDLENDIDCNHITISELENDIEYWRERAIRAEVALEEIELQNEESQQKA